MKKIIFAFAAIFMLAFSTNAQVAVTIMPHDSAGYVEQFPADIPVPVYDTDSIISINTSFGPHGEILSIDTIYPFVRTDTLHTGFYYLHAVANSGYRFERWEVTIFYNQYFDLDSATYIDSSWSETIVQNNVENDTSYDGWLDLDMGIPDMNDTCSLQWIDTTVDSIIVVAYFSTDPTNGVIVTDDNTPHLDVYPNPTNDVVVIDADFNSMTLYSLNGTVLYNGVESVLDLTKYNPGVYFVAVLFDNGTKIVKVVKR